jgi:hypothetical protein
LTPNCMEIGLSNACILSVTPASINSRAIIANAIACSSTIRNSRPFILLVRAHRYCKERICLLHGIADQHSLTDGRKVCWGAA